MAYIGNTATTQAFTPAVDFFNGDNSTVAFTLSRPVASVAQVQAVVENVPQKPGDAYTVSGNTITFTSAPPSGTQNIYVYYTSPITQVIAPGQGTVGTAQIQNGAVIPADLSAGAPTWSPSGGVTLPRIDSTNEGGQLNFNRASDDTAVWSIDSFGNTSTPTLRFINGATVAMAIDGSNNVGIGTSSPSSYGKFAVVSGATTFGIASDAYTSANFGPRPANDGTSTVLFTYTGTSFNKLDSTSTGLSFFANSKIGLQVFQDGSAALGGGATSTGAWGIIGANNSNAGYPTAAYGGTGVAMAWNFTAGGREVTLMNLDTGAGGGGGFRFVQRTGAATSSYLGNTASNGAWYQGNNSASWSVTSDIRIKQNVRPLNGALAKITALNPCHFEYKNTPEQIKTGFIAQEFEQVLPGHVHESEPDVLVKDYFEDGEKCKSIDADLIPYLVKAIQEQQAIIEQLTERITALEAK